MENYWRDKASEVPVELHDHPWNDMFERTLKAVYPETYREYSEGGYLHAWALVKTESAMQMYKILIDEGASHEDAEREALHDTMPSTPEDELPYSQEDVDAAEEEAAWEFIEGIQGG